MKKTIVYLCLFVAISMINFAYADSIYCNPCKPCIMKCSCAKRVKPLTDKGSIHNIGRGFVNIIACGLELPRGVVYENTRMPLVGLISGPVKGVALTLWRGIAGLTDVLSAGTAGNALYFKTMPDMPWNASWVPCRSCWLYGSGKTCIICSKKIRGPSYYWWPGAPLGQKTYWNADKGIYSLPNKTKKCRSSKKRCFKSCK